MQPLDAVQRNDGIFLNIYRHLVATPFPGRRKYDELQRNNAVGLYVVLRSHRVNLEHLCTRVEAQVTRCVHTDINFDALHVARLLGFRIHESKICDALLQVLEFGTPCSTRYDLRSNHAAYCAGVIERSRNPVRQLGLVLTQHVGRTLHVREEIVAPDTEIDLHNVAVLNHSMGIANLVAVGRADVDGCVPSGFETEARALRQATT